MSCYVHMSMLGETVGNFVVVGKLGQGGMGEVLLAEHREIKTKVAIKVLLPHISADKQHVQRFFNEAVAVSKIKHAGIARIFDVGYHTRGEAYLVMEFLEGESLAARIQRLGQLPYSQVFDFARQIASVLEATHAAGITHRDLKPDNIFLIPDAELAGGERVKVLDFGIAKLGASNMTQTNGAMGTPTYMSPEQWMSSAKVDGRADVYSLGCIAFEMACGRPPFVADAVGPLCAMHLTDPPPRVSSMLSDAPAAFDALVARLLEKQPQDRMSAAEAKAAWSKLVTSPDAPASADNARVPVRRVETSSEGSVATAKPTTLGGSAMQISVPPPARKSGKALLFVGLGAVAAVAATVAVVLSKHESSTTTASTTPPAAASAPVAAPLPAPAPVPAPAAAVPAVATTRLQIQTVPPAAEILIDNAAVSNPFDGKFPTSDARHHIEVRAEGYKTDARWVVFDAEHSLVVTLEQEPVAKTETGKKAAAKSSKAPTTTAATTPVPAPPQTAAAPKTEPVAVPQPPAPVQTAPADNGKATYRGSKATISTQFPTE